jgi:iron complex outermembrane recepter protein
MRYGRIWLLAAPLLPAALPALAADNGESITVRGQKAGFATQAQYGADDATLGPLGTTPLLQTPYDVQTATQDLITNTQARSLNDVLRTLPSVQIESRQGVDISRPQTRGFEGSIVQNTRADGLNVIGTTAYPAEEFQDIQVLTGLGGAIYGPSAPTGVFEYDFKRPTDQPLTRAIVAYDSDSILTWHLDAGGRAGRDGWFGYRLNLLEGNGKGPPDSSNQNRVLINPDFDIHLSPSTVLQLNGSHYHVEQTGYAGQFTFGPGTGAKGASTLLPSPPDPTETGIGQPGAGLRLTTDLGSARILSDLGNGWHLVLGGLYENANRGLYTINNNVTDNRGDFSVQQNFNAVARFTIGSNFASLNATKRILGFTNDLAFGTNGYVNGQYSGRNSIVTTLGSSSLANPRIFRLPAVSNGGTYESSRVVQQAVILGDTLHLNRFVAIRALGSPSWIRTDNFAATGRTTSSYTSSFKWSHTESLIVTPTDRLTIYGTYGNNLQQGDTAPTTGITNPGATVAPYRSEQYEVGAKYQLLPRLLLTLAGFHITRPYAENNPADDTFEVVGTQRNWGVEFFASGEVGPALSVIGGFTWLDPKLENTGVPTTNDRNVVGVPDWQSNVLLDYHPGWAHGGAGTLAVHYTGPRAATATNDQFSAAYTTLDLGLRYTHPMWGKPVTGRVQVTNVTDKHYYVSIFPATINGALGSDSAWLGNPRTVSASVEVDF